MPFEVFLPDAVKDQLSHLPRDIRQRIAQEIKTLQDFPFPHGNTIRRIQGSKKPIYRMRVGDYRVIYNLDTQKKQAIILSVVHRQNLESALKTLL
ncbi:TPA: type II toxin-antitoxin system RelE/ParE family toxin [bacterium]|nr:type II toxin-antitoxin system RelE/ParE family toxin [bacterium]